ncbi:MAG: lecithin retinol acyltransferase family protein [Phycisphaerales bacterium]|nr:lecithin retinol acyltransferase family protein [Phycisphaerales bacterium]
MAIGDHLFIKYIWGEHHGIDLGDGTVIEYGGKGEARLSVRRVWRDAFLARGPAFVKPYAPGAALPLRETVRLAFARLREQRYDLFNNNCEHLAYWCKTGHHRSPQADGLKGALAVGAVVGLVALAAGAAG